MEYNRDPEVQADFMRRAFNRGLFTFFAVFALAAVYSSLRLDGPLQLISDFSVVGMLGAFAVPGLAAGYVARTPRAVLYVFPACLMTALFAAFGGAVDVFDAVAATAIGATPCLLIGGLWGSQRRQSDRHAMDRPASPLDAMWGGW